jgi:hypothetical protein
MLEKVSSLPDFPPWGSEDALNQTANKEATDITQAVYYDINAHCKCSAFKDFTWDM